MKKIIFLIFVVSNFLFAWEKVNQVDEFGDTTGEYVLSQKIEENFGNVVISRKYDGTIVAGFFFPNDNLGNKNITIKMKSKNGVNELIGNSQNSFVFLDRNSTRLLLIALRDSNLVKFNIFGVPLSVSGIGFTKMYKNAYWQKFNSNNPIEMPPLGKKVYSLTVGEKQIEEQDNIWN